LIIRGYLRSASPLGDGAAVRRVGSAFFCPGWSVDNTCLQDWFRSSASHPDDAVGAKVNQGAVIREVPQEVDVAVERPGQPGRIRSTIRKVFRELLK
jgi:hypothetical protein